MSMVCGLDLHRGQITFDALEVESGEVWRGRFWSAGPGPVPSLAGRRGGPPSWTADRWRWRWRAAPGGAMWSRRSSPRASRRMWPSRPTPRRPGAARSTPRPTAPTPGCCGSCCRAGICPRSWIPPEAVLEWRERVRLYKSLIDQRRMWIQRIHAELFQHGVSLPEGQIASPQNPGLAGRRARCSSPRPPASASRSATR